MSAELLLEEVQNSFYGNLKTFEDEKGWKIRKERAKEGEVFLQNVILDKMKREELVSNLLALYPGLKIRLDNNPVDHFGNPVNFFEENAVVAVYLSFLLPE